jgi:hypothetical protein
VDDHLRTIRFEKLKNKIQEVEERIETLALENYEQYKFLEEKEAKIEELKKLIAKQESEREKDRQIMLLVLKQERKREQNDRIMLRHEHQLEKDRDYLYSLGISLEEVKDQNEELLNQNICLRKKMDNIQRKLGLAVKDPSPQQPENRRTRERFVLIKRNDLSYMSYYTILEQDLYTTRKLKIERIHFPRLKVLLDFKCDSNSKTMYTKIKENLKARGVVFNGNNIDLDETIITEKELIEEMKAVK